MAEICVETTVSFDEMLDMLVHVQRRRLLEWDRRNHEVVKGPNFEAIRPLLELLDDHQDELPEDWL